MNNINQTMGKKVILVLFLAFISITASAQERGLHLTLSGTLGATTLGYTTDTDVKSKFNLGFGGGIGAQYFFTQHWGLSLGVDVTRYKSHAVYYNDYVFKNMVDNAAFTQGVPYNLHLGLNNWKEIQKSLFLEIPLLAMYQKKWGKKEGFGMYFGLGAKLQLPVFKSTNKYEVTNGSELSVVGYTPAYDLTIDYLPDYGFGDTKNTGYKGNFNLKVGVAATAELGFLIKLSRRWDLMVGAYADYSFLNMKGKNNTDYGYLVGPEGNANTIHSSVIDEKVGYIGERVEYNGFLGSTTVEKANPIAIGGKLGIRVKLGKLKPIEEEEEIVQEEDSTQIEFNNAILDAIKDLQKGLNEILTWKDMVADLLKPEEPKKDEYPYGMTKEEYDIITAGPVYFALNSYVIRDSEKAMLNRQVAIMNKYPQMSVKVAGNTCDLGSSSLNGTLGLNRAKAARAYMISHGISESRIIISSQSFNNPMLPNVSEDNRSRNRRCDFELIPPRN